MNKANYLGSPAYPLSTESLDFVQQQIMLTAQLANIYGGNYRLINHDNSEMVVLNGEMYTLTGVLLGATHIQIIVNNIDITAGAQTYTNAQQQRTAIYTNLPQGELGVDNFIIASVPYAANLKTTLSELQAQVISAGSQPRGTIAYLNRIPLSTLNSYETDDDYCSLPVGFAPLGNARFPDEATATAAITEFQSYFEPLVKVNPGESLLSYWTVQFTPLFVCPDPIVKAGQYAIVKYTQAPWEPQDK